MNYIHPRTDTAAGRLLDRLAPIKTLNLGEENRREWAERNASYDLIEAVRVEAAAAERAETRAAWEDGKRRYMSRMHDVGSMSEFVDGMLADPVDAG